MDFKVMTMEIPQDANIILGQTHFIKTTEDLYEILSTSSSGIKFGLSFCEASGPCLIRAEGNDEVLKEAAIRNARALSCGHVFVILMQGAFPINVLNAVKMCPEVCSVFCATANPLQVIVAQTEQGSGVVGVVDGFSPKGTEKQVDVQARKKFLRDIGYKL